MSKTRLKASNLFRSICICKIACEKEMCAKFRAMSENLQPTRQV